MARAAILRLARHGVAALSGSGTVAVAQRIIDREEIGLQADEDEH